MLGSNCADVGQILRRCRLIVSTDLQITYKAMRYKHFNTPCQTTVIYFSNYVILYSCQVHVTNIYWNNGNSIRKNYFPDIRELNLKEKSVLLETYSKTNTQKTSANKEKQANKGSMCISKTCNELSVKNKILIYGRTPVLLQCDMF